MRNWLRRSGGLAILLPSERRSFDRRGEVRRDRQPSGGVGTTCGHTASEASVTCLLRSTKWRSSCPSSGWCAEHTRLPHGRAAECEEVGLPRGERSTFGWRFGVREQLFDHCTQDVHVERLGMPCAHVVVLHRLGKLGPSRHENRHVFEFSASCPGLQIRPCAAYSGRAPEHPEDWPAPLPLLWRRFRLQ